MIGFIDETYSCVICIVLLLVVRVKVYYTCACIKVYECVCMRNAYQCAHVRMHVYDYAHTPVCMCNPVNTYASALVYACVRMYVCICVYGLLCVC